jgi:hypothetical protein
MKRCAFKLLVFLLVFGGGAIINVAVAWGIALWSSRPRTYTLEWKGVDWLAKVPDDWPSPDRMWTLNGSMRIFVLNGHTSSGDYIDQSFLQHEIQSGFPLYALSMFAKGVQSSPRKFPVWEWNKRLRVPFENRATSWNIPVEGVPLNPLVSGFAINTIFYAAIAWVLFAAPGAVRRRLRRKRGQCAACGYSVCESVSGKCSECGTQTDAIGRLESRPMKGA